jgi:hypothetical protein
MSVVGRSVRNMEHNVFAPAEGAKPPYSWSVSETDQLVAHYLAGMSLDHLSRWSRRSPHHVVVQLAWALHKVGRGDVNPLAPRFREPWSDEESEQVGNLIDAGVTLDEVARSVGRDLTDVAWHLVISRQSRPGISLAG